MAVDFRATWEALFASWDAYGVWSRAYHQERRLRSMEALREARRIGLAPPPQDQVSNDHG